MENGGNNKMELRLYKCGLCKNNLGHMFRHHGKEVRFFPALVVLIKHPTMGNILYDTGYSKLIYKNHFVSFLYNALNRSYVKDSDTIVAKLQAEGINPTSVKKVILSHAHPDHIGGLRLLHNYELISTQQVIETLKNGNVFQLVFRNMKPQESIDYRYVHQYQGDTFLKKYFDVIYDVLEDGSILGVELNGHAAGQLGIYIPEQNIFLAADACWGTDLLCKVQDMRLLARMIQNNYSEYVDTVRRIERLIKENPEIKVIFSHDTMEEVYYEQ